MGNAVAPRMMCREAGTAVVTGRRRRPTKSVVAAAPPPPPAAAAPRRLAVAARNKHDGVVYAEEEEARRRRRREAAATDAAADHQVTVKIVMKRKDAEELVARLNAQNARERKARMTELNSELRVRETRGCGGGASPAPCGRDAWRPRLAPIQENQ